MMDHMQLDLSLVKKEPRYFEDYGHNAGNILDNIIPEPEFDQFAHAAPSVPNAEDMDQGVDWLNSFFDEPSHETCNINGLNPPISKLSDIPMNSSNGYPSVVKLLGQNTHNGTLLETLNLISDEYTNDMVYKSPNSVRTPSPDPFFGPTQDSRIPLNRTQEIDLPQVLRKAQNFKVLTQIDKNSLNLATARELIQRLKAESQNSLAHRLPEQRLGHVQNHKIHQRSNDGNLMSMVKAEPDSNGNDSVLGNHSLLSRISCTVPELSSLQNGRPLCYDSPSQPSPGCAPTSPICMLGDKECSNSSADNTPTSDQPQDRQPFYLSEEERRTLITEGLPIPMGYPLSKVEERALKKVRRKIKNKISAQESRRKKKEYMEALEKKLEIVNGESSDLKKKVETLESTNRTLISQLHKLQAIVSAKSSKDLTNRTTQTSQLAMK